MRLNKKQATAIVIAFLFFGSTIAFAINWVIPEQETGEKEYNIFEQPISNSQREQLIKNDVTIFTFFYLDEDEESYNAQPHVNKLAENFKEKILIEKINIRIHQLFSSEYNVRSVPTIIIRGKANKNEPIRLERVQDYETLEENICKTYENKPEICGLK